jgi:apolipoprotein N-acyltransferase
MFARLAAASLGGVCIALSFAPTGFWAAAFAGVALLLRAANGTSARASFLIGWTGGCAGHLVACAWLWKAIAGFTGMSSSSVAACVAAVIAYHGLQFGVFSLLAANRRRYVLGSHCAEISAIWVVV